MVHVDRRDLSLETFVGSTFTQLKWRPSRCPVSHQKATPDLTLQSIYARFLRDPFALPSNWGPTSPLPLYDRPSVRTRLTLTLTVLGKTLLGHPGVSKGSGLGRVRPGRVHGLTFRKVSVFHTRGPSSRVEGRGGDVGGERRTSDSVR